MAELPDHLVDYRKHLVTAEQKAQEDFDKTVLSLSGGALGISFVFLKDVIGSQPINAPAALMTAWVCWGLSSLAVLVSFFLSQQALRFAIKQVDDGTIAGGRPGGKLSIATATFNAVGAVLFAGGVIAITYFAGENLKTRGALNGNTPAATVSAPAAAASAPASASAPAAARAASPSAKGS